MPVLWLCPTCDAPLTDSAVSSTEHAGVQSRDEEIQSSSSRVEESLHRRGRACSALFFKKQANIKFR